MFYNKIGFAQTQQTCPARVGLPTKQKSMVLPWQIIPIQHVLEKALHRESSEAQFPAIFSSISESCAVSSTQCAISFRIVGQPELIRPVCNNQMGHSAHGQKLGETKLKPNWMGTRNRSRKLNQMEWHRHIEFLSVVHTVSRGFQDDSRSDAVQPADLQNSLFQYTRPVSET